jgi:hypothetical protein
MAARLKDSRHLDAHGKPIGAAERIDVDLTGSASRRDAQVRHAIARLLHYTRQHGITAIAVEDLDFADARTTGAGNHGPRRPRETLPPHWRRPYETSLDTRQPPP